MFDNEERLPSPFPARTRTDPVRSAPGTALRLAAARVRVDAAVEELRGMANGRGDLLAEQAGLMIDAASVRPVTAEYRAAVRLLIATGANEDQLAGWVEIERQRGSAPAAQHLSKARFDLG